MSSDSNEGKANEMAKTARKRKSEVVLLDCNEGDYECDENSIIECKIIKLHRDSDSNSRLPLINEDYQRNSDTSGILTFNQTIQHEADPNNPDNFGK